MLKMVKKFFDFCNQKNRGKFYRSAILGVIDAIFTAMKIPAAFFAIKALTKEKTIIMIAHRLKTVRHADQIVVVDGGRIAQKGTHEELMAEDGIYRRFIADRREAASWKIAAQG